MWVPSSEFVSSSIPSLQILTAHAQPFRWARDLAFCLKVPLDSLLVWASSGGSGETARMRRLAWTFAARIGDKYQNRLARSMYLQRLRRGYGLKINILPCIVFKRIFSFDYVTKFDLLMFGAKIISWRKEEIQSNLSVKTTQGRKVNWSLFTGGLYSEGQF